MNNKIKLPKSCRLLAEFFADQREETVSLYKKRGGFKREDIVAGAMGEMAAYLWLSKKGYSVDSPDLTIHSKKSYNADLSDGKYFFHIKSQTTDSADKYGDSWILQKTDKLTTNPQDKHFVVLCNVNIETGMVEIKSCVSAKLLVDREAYGEPKLDWFKKTKVALYLHNIKESVGKLFTLRSKNG